MIAQQRQALDPARPRRGRRLPFAALALSGSASAAEVTPIAEYLDATIASTSEALVSALATMLGVS